MKYISAVASICLATMLCSGCDNNEVHPGHEDEAYTDVIDQNTGRPYRIYQDKNGNMTWFDLASGSMIGSMAGSMAGTVMGNMLFNNDRDRNRLSPAIVPSGVSANNLTPVRSYSPTLGHKSFPSSGKIAARGTSFGGMNAGS